MSDEDTIEIADMARVFQRKSLLDNEAQNAARYHGLTDVDLRLDQGIGMGPEHIDFSRAATSGTFQRLDATEARQIAADLRLIDGRALGDWLAGGDVDDLQEMADALEAAADVLDASNLLDDEMINAARAKVYEDRRDD